VRALALAAIPFIPLLATSAPDMYRNMIEYKSIANNWGINAFLNPATRQADLQSIFEPIRDAFIDYGRYLVLAAVVGLALASRLRLHFSMLEQFALGGALFLILTPGFGVQYVILVVALLILVSLRYGVAWACLAGVSIGIYYSAVYLTGKAIKRDPNLDLLWTETGLLAWALLVIFFWRYVSARWRATSESSLASETGSPA
jgi:hypothetical protein